MHLSFYFNVAMSIVSHTQCTDWPKKVSPVIYVYINDKFPRDCNSERIFQIGYYLMWAMYRISGAYFFGPPRRPTGLQRKVLGIYGQVLGLGLGLEGLVLVNVSAEK